MYCLYHFINREYTCRWSCSPLKFKPKSVVHTQNQKQIHNLFSLVITFFVSLNLEIVQLSRLMQINRYTVNGKVGKATPSFWTIDFLSCMAPIYKGSWLRKFVDFAFVNNDHMSCFHAKTHFSWFIAPIECFKNEISFLLMYSTLYLTSKVKAE